MLLCALNSQFEFVVQRELYFLEACACVPEENVKCFIHLAGGTVKVSIQKVCQPVAKLFVYGHCGSHRERCDFFFAT
jgi:hypothetical protein